MSETENAGQPAKKVVSVSGVLAALHNGKTREEIRVELGLTKKELTRVFQHPKLKNKKTIKGVADLEIVDDTIITAEGAPGGQVATAMPTEEAKPGETIDAAQASTARTTRAGRSSAVAEESKQPEAKVAEGEIETPEVEEIPAKEETEKSPWDR